MIYWKVNFLVSGIFVMKILIVFIGFLISSTLFMETFAQGVDLPNDFGTIVYEFNGLYYVKDSQRIIASNDTPDIIIKTALDRGGEIYIAGGSYYLTKDFSGFDLQYGTHLKLAQDAYIVVPSGYQGYVFRFNTGTGQCVMEGGSIYEANPIKRSWIGIMMQGGTNGVSRNFIENVIVTYPYIVIDFNATTGQWINANTFVNIKGESFVRGIEFDFKGKHSDGIDGFDGNTFRDISFQSGSMTTYGVKDIKHQYNAFYNVQVWDLPPGAISSNIDASAKNTVIIGGIMTNQGFVDNGTNTIVLDPWHNKLTSNSAILLAINATYHPKVNMPPMQSSQVLNMSIITQPTSGFVTGNQGQLALSPGKSIVVNIFGTITNSAGGSVSLHITRPDGVVEQNQADVTSAGSFYYPMIFDKNSLTGQYKIEGSYQNSNLGSLLLNVTSDQVALASIKSSAKLWSQGQISDDTFGNSIQYLFNVGIIEKPNGSQTSFHQPLHIPTWFKNNAYWWADGQTSDSDFISAIQYLLDSGIMRVS